ncbi:unnamed protein product [Microthlaspi erraticum]|uniref:Uncharacterized protein n=1 Tax=Microthlaspi erraticum TaxID=1685480 RepID=A0A6D2JBT4_9BRAS|nr:unnamed protein product [Microthlaspi erraticum]
MVEGESSNARERRLKMQADLERMTQRMEESDAEEYVYSEEESESERLREERRTKKRNDPISSESEQGEFEIGVNLVQEEGKWLSKCGASSQEHALGQAFSYHMESYKELTCEFLASMRSFGAFWSIWDERSMEDLAHGRSSTGYAKEEGGSHLEDQLDHLLDQPVEFLNSTGQASTRSS